MGISLSLILINYNHSKYLKRAIEERIEQKDFFSELIIVDDGSTDESSSIIKRYQKKYTFIKPIFHEKNEGIFKAVASGIEASVGDYIHMGAVDDILDQSFYKKSACVLSNHPKAAFVFSDPGEFVESQNTYVAYPFNFSSKSRYFSPKDINKMLKKSYFTFPSMSCIFHKKKFLKMGGFREDLGRNCDLFVTFLLSLRYGVCYIPEVLSWFCVRDNSYSSVGLRDKKNIKSTLYKTLEVLESYYPEDYKKFREVGISYEHSFRAIWWLIVSKKHRKYITLFLIKRMIFRGMWGHAKKILPTKTRHFIRKIRGYYLKKLRG